MTGDDDQQVLEIAKKKMESIVLALTIVSGAPLILSDVQIERKESTSEKQKTITLIKTLTCTYNIIKAKKLKDKQLEQVSILATKLESLTPDEREALLRIHRWFYRAKFDMTLLTDYTVIHSIGGNRRT